MTKPMTIGRLIENLKEEFPDISVSKIRFLESEGLIEPDRTASGYRKFSEGDLARLRYILRLQRDHFMPLKVIRERLERMDLEDVASEEPSGNGSRLAPPPVEGEDEELAPPDESKRFSLEELSESSGLEVDRLVELEEYGLVDPHRSGDEVFYDLDDLAVAKIARDLAKYGIEPRHLKMYRHFIDRESGLFEQIVAPRTHGGEARQSVQSLRELARLSRRLKQVLLRMSLRGYLGA